ncbi:MAG: hypothetical protein QUS33_08245 [Dehalococcoidia bacterium]|nr:hypothetical protein [Dehalococcoidia bacterium]
MSPADGAAGITLTPTLQSSDFSDPDAGDAHGVSQWQITAVAGDYSVAVFDSQTDNVNLVSIVVPSGKLSFSTTYYWHVRHQDDHGEWSAWSAETSFTTMSAPNQAPAQPVNISPANGAAGITLTPTLQSSDFSDPDAGDTHGASQWQITAVAGDYSVTVFDSQADDVNLLSIVVPTGKLSFSTTYYWHVRHQDSHGEWSAWSVETSFVTEAAPEAAPEEPEDESVPDVPSPPPAQPADQTAPAEPEMPAEPDDDTETAGSLPTASDSRGPLPFVLAVIAGVGAVAIVGTGLFLAYTMRLRALSKPRGLSSARTISKRLRK